MKTTLQKWAAAHYGEDAPHIKTLRRWVREGKIFPLPKKKGRTYYLDKSATYVAKEEFFQIPGPAPSDSSFFADQNARAAYNYLFKLKRCPSWADNGYIQALYQIASRVTQCLGIPFHVDHVVPIKGRTVSGLHVEANLRVIPARQNLIKGNRWGAEWP